MSLKKKIWVYGIIAGVITSVWFIVMIAFGSPASSDMTNGMIYGYASMLIAFSLIFVAIKNYRDKMNQGNISFGKAFQIGLYITLIASTIYVVTWLIDYYYFIPDFMDKYAASTIEKLKTSGASASEIEKTTIEMAVFKERYKNPFFNAMMTYTEILPVGLIVSLIASAILKRKDSMLTGE